MSSLTKRQSQILSLIQSIREAKGYNPTYRELMAQLGLSSPATLHKHITNLKTNGHLKDAPRGAKALKPSPFMQVPIIGMVAKGKKLELFATSKSIEIPLSQVDVTETLYGFYAKDDSFKDLSILKDDLIIIKASQKCEESSLLLVQSKSLGTLIGRLRISYGMRLLETTEETISFDEHSLHIQGTLISLQRKIS